MEFLQLVVLIIGVFSVTSGKPTTESTHALLKRLGFDPVQRTSQVNHHSKRVALETNKARYHNDFYSSNSDSRMFVVKLPPHFPYYSHLKPEKFKNEAVAKPVGSLGATNSSGTSSKAENFRTNGKPASIYHWNIPVLRKLTPKKGTSLRNINEDSKVYHIKILPNQTPPKNSIAGQDAHKKNKHKTKQQTEGSNKVNKYFKNKLYRLNDSSNGTSNSNTNSTANNEKFDFLNIKLRDSAIPDKRGSSNYYGSNKKVSEKYVNEVSKIKSKTNRGPNYYVPAIPQQNSFHKYFTGNGKLKSFYVIEKSKKQTRLHRLL